LAIPARPQLPAFLNDVIGPAATPAPAAGVPAATVPAAKNGFQSKFKRGQFGSYLSNDDAIADFTDFQAFQKSQTQSLADTQGWPDWIRKQFGLAATGRDAAFRGVEDMVANYRSGVSQDLSPQALSWAKQQPYLQQWSLGKTSNVADQFPILNGLL
jgi:hypothetical protein